MNGNEALDAIAAQFGIDPSTGTVTPPDDAETADVQRVDPLEGWSLVREPEEPWWADLFADGAARGDFAEIERDAPTINAPVVIEHLTATNSSTSVGILRPVETLLAQRGDAPTWLFDALIPSGGVTLLVGKTKSGKSTLAFHAAHAVGEGRDFLACSNLAGGPRKVALLSVEGGWLDELADRRTDGWNEWLLPADPAEVRKLAMPATGTAWRDRWQELGEAIAADGQFGLIIVDHLLGFTTTSGRTIKEDSTVTPFIDALNELAQRTGCAILLLHHASTKSGNTDPILGSSAIASMCRAILVLKERSEKTGRQTVKGEANRAVGVLEARIAQTPTTLEVLKVERKVPSTDADETDDVEGEAPEKKPRTGRGRRGASQKAASSIRTAVERQEAIKALIPQFGGKGQRNAAKWLQTEHGYTESFSTLCRDLKALGIGSP